MKLNFFNNIIFYCMIVCISLMAENIELQNKAIEQDEKMQDLKQNYVLSVQTGIYYTQDIGNYINDSKDEAPRAVDFTNLFISAGFEGIEFDHFRFGANLLGNIKLIGGKTSDGDVYSDSINKNAILYQAFLGYVSDYFDLSAGREILDLEWVNDFVQGARFVAKIPNSNTQISGFYFDKQGVADPNKITDFEDNKVGPTFIASISNNSLYFLPNDIYFMSLRNFNGIGIGGALLFGGKESIFSTTLLKYTYLDSKLFQFKDTNFLQLEENLEFNIPSNFISITLGVIKMFNAENLNSLEINVLGDQNPLEQGNYVYSKNASTIYVGANYLFDDFLEISFLYGNTSGMKEWDDDSFKNTKLKSVNEINLGLNFHWHGLEINCIYSKILSDNLEERSTKKLNRNYFETMVAYNF